MIYIWKINEQKLQEALAPSLVRIVPISRSLLWHVREEWYTCGWTGGWPNLRRRAMGRMKWWVVLRSDMKWVWEIKTVCPKLTLSRNVFITYTFTLHCRSTLLLNNVSWFSWCISPMCTWGCARKFTCVEWEMKESGFWGQLPWQTSIWASIPFKSICWTQMNRLHYLFSQ